MRIRPRSPISIIAGTVLLAGLAGAGGCSDSGAGASDESTPATAPANESTAQTPAGSADEVDDNTTAADLVSIRVIADTPTVSPGRTFHLAVIFDIRDHWHTYWINPGDSGMPTQVDIDAPDGFTVGATRFPRPQVIRTPNETTYGYEERTVLFVPITAPQELASEDVTITADIGYLVCKVACLLGSEELSVTLPTATGADASTSLSAADAELIETYRSRVPRPLETLTGARTRLDDGRLIVEGPAGEHYGADLLPIPVPGVTFGEPQASVTDGRFRIAVPIELDEANAMGEPMAVRGVVTLGKRLDDPAYSFNLPVDGEIVSAAD